jgi:hypothetical protein
MTINQIKPSTATVDMEKRSDDKEKKDLLVLMAAAFFLCCCNFRFMFPERQWGSHLPHVE